MNASGTPESFGARLRSQRERQHVTLDTIADRTKIKLSLLEALERDDMSRWPGGIFRRAFIRAYAQAIGLDPDPIVREFLERYPDPDEVASIETAHTSSDEGLAGRGAWFRAALGATMRSLARGVVDRAPNLPQEDVRHAPTLEISDETVVAHPIEDPGDSEQRVDAAGDPAPPPAPAGPDIEAVARLCTALACVGAPDELTPLLEQAAAVLDAAGIVLWLWDSDASALRATLAYGYSNAVLAQLPTLDRDADNATAAALRLRQACIVGGTDRLNGALAVPLVTASGCAGVLALEVRGGGERNHIVRAAATIVAAQLAAMLHVPAAAADRKLA